MKYRRPDGSVVNVDVTIVTLAPQKEDVVTEVERIRGWYEWQPVPLQVALGQAETGKDVYWRDMGTLLGRVDNLTDTVKWMAQTIHQAHHEGPIEDCPKNTCGAAMKALGKKE